MSSTDEVAAAASPELQPGWISRPSFHITPPHGWMNDPCAPGYDPETKRYHLFYQWNPKSCGWGDISWGQLTSTDCINWEPVAKPILEPDMPYDKKGLFTGCFFPRGENGEKGQLTVFYSSICHLPFHWSTPYPRGCAGLALANSKDGGITWMKSNRNPILEGEPEDAIVTGFRDPSLAEWEVLDDIRGKHSLYGIIAGGLRDKGPTIFLYTVSPDDLTKWNYLCPLLDLPLNFRPSKKWSADYGVNWECTNFMTLKSGRYSREFLFAASEGGAERDHWKDHKLPPGFPERFPRWVLWFSGGLHKTGEKISMEYEFGGILDHGCFYAPNSVRDPITGRRIVWGWLPEDDIDLDRCERKGWAGYLSIPRELYLLVIPNVVEALKTPLKEISSVNIQREADGTTSLHTLGIRPFSDLTKIRHGAPINISNLTLPTSQSTVYKTPIQCSRWELEAIIDIKDGCERVGFYIRHNEDMSIRTTIYFLPGEEEIVVERNNSNTDPNVNKPDDRGPHTLFKIQKGGTVTQEMLHLRIFCDNGIIEIYANDRFALSTIVYVDREEDSGISCFALGQRDSAVFDVLNIWTELG